MTIVSHHHCFSLWQVICGVMTATFGGVVRDTLAQRPVRILHSHADIYATTAACGATTYVVAHQVGMPLWVRLSLGFGMAVVMRFAANTHNIVLPTWESLGAGDLVVRKRAAKPS
jgi:uncharacterized membrane protein YeiH